MNSVTKCPKSLIAISAQNLYSSHTSLCVVDSTTVNLASSSLAGSGQKYVVGKQ